jgi:hypothetical protein
MSALADIVAKPIASLARSLRHMKSRRWAEISDGLSARCASSASRQKLPFLL